MFIIFIFVCYSHGIVKNQLSIDNFYQIIPNILDVI